ncbi:MAG: hypothetical protein WB992_21890, partial [Bryobacteraceae bacterium]
MAYPHFVWYEIFFLTSIQRKKEAKSIVDQEIICKNQAELNAPRRQVAGGPPLLSLSYRDWDCPHPCVLWGRCGPPARGSLVGTVN